MSLFVFLSCLLFLIPGPAQSILQVVLILLVYSLCYSLGQVLAKKNFANRFLVFSLYALDCLAVTSAIYLTGGLQSDLYFLYLVILGVSLYRQNWVAFTYEAVLSVSLYVGLLVWMGRTNGGVNYWFIAAQTLLLGSLIGVLTALLLVLKKDQAEKNKLISRARTLAHIADVVSGSLSNSRDWIKTITGLIEDEIHADGLTCRIFIHRGEQQFLPPSGGKTGLHLPIMVGEIIFGSLIVHWTRLKPLSMQDNQFFSSIAHSLGLSLHRAKLWEDFQSQMERIEAGLRLTSSVPSTLSNEAQKTYQQRVVNDMLEMVRLERGKWEIKKDICFITDLLKNEIDVVMGASSSKNLTFSTDWRDADLSPFWADNNKIKHVIANLLYNAVEASPFGGKITLRARQDERQILVSIHNQGQGIPDAELNDVFEKYYRLGPIHEPSKPSHFGLGLAICQKIVQAHKGHIWAESKGEGQGSTLWVSLPVEPVSVKSVS